MELRAQALEWFRGMITSRQKSIVNKHYPNEEFSSVAMSTPMIEIMYIKETQSQGHLVAFVSETLRNMSESDFVILTIHLGEYDIWKKGKEYGIDGIANVRDRMMTINLNFELDDYEKYYRGIKHLDLVKK